MLNEKTGKVVRNLVTHDRLKACDIHRQSGPERLPNAQQAEGSIPQNQVVELKADKGVVEPKPLRIIRIKSTGGRKQYLVRYSDSKDYWCCWVSKLLLDNYKRRQAKSRDDKRGRPRSTRS